MEKPMEFWLNLGVRDDQWEGDFVYKKEEDLKRHRFGQKIHVIEYSAYEKLLTTLTKIHEMQKGEPYSSHLIVEEALGLK